MNKQPQADDAAKAGALVGGKLLPLHAARVSPASSSSSVTEEEWPEIAPLRAVAAPAFPVDALPPVLAAWVAATAHSTQTPPDLAAFVALAVVAAAGARRIEVEPKSGWTEPVNLFVCVALPSGNRKSAVFGAGTAPLREYEREQATAVAPLIAEQASARRILESRMRAAEGAAANPKADQADRDQATAEAADLARKIAESPVITVPRLIIDDATVEKIPMMLAENGERIAILSAEGGIFGILAGRYTDGAVNVDVILKAHAGDDLRVDRVQRAPVMLTRPALTMGLAIQPSVMHGVLATTEFRGRGLPARFLYSVPRSLIGSRDVDAPGVEAHVSRDYMSAIRRILDQPVPKEPIVATFSAEAWSSFRGWMNDHERALGDGGDLELLRDWGSKLPGALARIAGLFHLLDGGADGTIGGDHVDRALALAPYLIDHARIAHSVIGADPATVAAEAILQNLDHAPAASFTKRELHRRMQKRFERSTDLDAPLKLLVERGHLRRPDPTMPQGEGRTPSPVYLVHPRLRSGGGADA